MAINPQFKVNQLAKNLGFKTKDITDLMAQKGIEVKSQKVLEPWEFEILFETLTRSSQVTDIDRYIDGEVCVPSRLPGFTAADLAAKEAAAKEAAAKEAAAKEAAAKEAAAKEAAAKEAAAKEAAAKEAAAKEAAAKEAAAKEAAAKEAAAKEAVAKEAAAKEAAVKEAEEREKQAVARKPQSPQSLQNMLNQQRMEAQRSGKPMPAPIAPKAPAQPTRQSKQQQNNTRSAAQAQAPQNGRQNGQKQGQQQNSAERQAAQSSRYQNPLAGQGGRQQNGNAQQSRQKPQNSGRDRGMGADKDFVPNTPREKFQPQAIVRAQTPKGGDGANKQRGAVRLVDMRSNAVDLSKYDEKLDTFDTVADSASAKPDAQRGKKQAAAMRQQNSGKGNFAGGRTQQQNGRNANQSRGGKKQQPVKKAPLNVQIPDEIIVSDLAALLKVTAGEVVKRLMMMGVMATLNQAVDYDTAALVAEELGAIPSKEVVVTIEEKLFGDQEANLDKPEDLVDRAPVVCVMGHVDHGKTSLLDAIRHTNVTTGEAGGITQHIGAYRVKIKGRDITFLDTPGHEAFTAMRARGAQATDIAILVVAADDGIMPQTVEAINHAKAAGIDIVVAINKMDKPAANPEGIKQELTKYDLVPEEWGGDVICVPVSALTKQGIDDLLESVLLVADIKELKANPARRAKGVVIEAKLDRGRGPVATVLVQNGTLHPGDIVIAGTAVGRVRAMTDYMGRTVKTAGPSVPVEITGLDAVPTAGDEFNAVEDERMARELADRRRTSAKEENFRVNARASLDDLFAQISEGIKTLNIIVKADVGGSAEAVKASLAKLANEEVKVNVIHAAAGGITEGDVMFAAASNAIIVGFNTRPDKQALDSAERQGVEIRTYRVIYECIEEITAAMKGMLAPKFREVLLGHVEVRQIFKISKVGTIAGSYVQDGKVTRNSKIRIVRDGVVIFEDEIASLRREKDDVKEVAAGYECGIGLEKYNDIKLGDILEAYVMEEIKR